MSTLLRVNLTSVELRHLLSLLLEEQKSGQYAGNKSQYYSRTVRCIEKIQAALADESRR